jgi:hypothetical protein
VIYDTLTSLTVRKTVLQEEWVITKQFAAVSAVEAFGVEVLANRVQAILKNKIKSYKVANIIIYYVPP